MPLSRNYKITSHCQQKFERLMAIDKLTIAEIYGSLNSVMNRDKVFGAGEGAGASGSFFFFSYDNRFLIKTLQGSERSVMLNMLDDYIEHIDYRPESLLSRIYGIFTISTKQFPDLDVMIMQNTARLRNPENRVY